MLKFLKLVSLLELREAMYSKNSRGYNEEDVPEKKRFRANLSDAFLAGQITAARTASLFKGAQASGATGVDDLAAVGDKNAARSLKRKMLKGSHWPDCYYADIELHDPKLQENHQVSLPFLLPHEIVGKLFEFGDSTWILSQHVLQEGFLCRASHREIQRQFCHWGSGMTVSLAIGTGPKAWKL